MAKEKIVSMEGQAAEEVDPMPGMEAKDDVFRCKDCGAVFEIVRTYKEDHAAEVVDLMMKLPWEAMEHRCGGKA